MVFLKKIKQDYLESRFSEYEGFLEWFLKRKLNFWGKIVFAYTLWAILLFILSHPIYLIYLFYIVFGLSLIVVCIEIYDGLNKKK